MTGHPEFRPRGPLGSDPRFIEYQRARADVEKGLQAPAGARERYRAAVPHLLDLMAEHGGDTPARKHLMRALVQDGGHSLGMVLAAFKGDQEERTFIEQHPPTAPEPVDEIERLQNLPYGAYLKSEHWQRVRADALRRADGRCTLCNATESLQVHHRDYDRRGAERPTDVVVLCGGCHGAFHKNFRVA